MGEDPIQTWLGRQAAPPEADPIGSWLGQARAPRPQTPAPGFFDAFSQAFPRVAHVAEAAAKPFTDIYGQVRDTGREAADLVRAGNYPGAFERVARPVTSAFTELENFVQHGPPKPVSREAAAEQGLELAGIPAADLAKRYREGDISGAVGEAAGTAALLGLMGRAAGGHGEAVGERPVAVRPEAPRAPRGGEATPGQPVEARRPWWDVPALPAHEPPGLPAPREPIVPPAPREPAGLLPERGGGPFESPGEEAPPRIPEASRWQHPVDAVAAFLEKAQPEAPRPPAGPSEADLVAQHFGFKDAAEMRARGNAIAPAQTPRLDPALFRDVVPEGPAEPPVVAPGEPRALEPTPAPPAEPDAVAGFLAHPEPLPDIPTRVPFEVADPATLDRLPREADLSKPTLERVPLQDLVATQEGLTPDVVRRHIEQPPADLAEVPATARGRFDPDAVTVIRGADGRNYLSGGTHRATAALLRGEPDIQAVVYPSKTGAAATTPMPRNLRDFLVRQLGIPPNEVDAMTPDDARAIGESVRNHPEGVQAGIRANRRVPPENTEPVPPLQVAGRGELNAAARAERMRATAVPRSEINVSRETSDSSVGPPRRTIAQRLTAGETLTEGERAQAGLPPGEPPARQQFTPSELATQQADIRNAARDRARLLEAGTPESLAAYEKSLAEANARQAQREFVHNRGDEPKRTGRGEILAGGPLGFLAYAPEAWRQLREMAPDIARAINDLVREPGKPIGRQELRRAPTPGKDIHPLMQAAHPNYALPDLWAQIKADLLAARDAMGDEAPPGVDRAQWAKVTHDLWHGDAIKTIDAYEKQARADGRPKAANYARAMSAQLRGLPTRAEQIAEIVTLGKLSPMRARQVFRAAENVLYNRLFIGALDTGILTRSQVLAAMPHLGLRGVVEGLREGRTPEGERAAESVTSLSPTDTALSKKISNNTVRRIVNLVTNPVGTAHRANRRDTFLSGVKMAREAGASPDDARAFADDLQELVHGSPMSTNPYIRHFGPLRMLSKYPIVMAQYIHSVATHPDPGVRRRGLGFVLGAAGVSGVLGVSLLDYFLPHLKSIGGPMLKIAQDVYDHATGNAGHSLLEDFDPRRGGTALTGRYPEKIYRTVRDVAEHGLGTHTKESLQGEPVGETSGIDELANLIGLHTRYGLPDILGLRASNEADRKAALADAEDFIKQASRDRSISGRLAREDAARGDAAAMQALTPAQRRAFNRAQQESAFQALLKRVPVAQRQEFIQKFAGRFAGTP